MCINFLEQNNVFLFFVFFLGTSNHLNDNDEGYDNITVARNLGLPDLELLRFVHEQITPGSVFLFVFSFNNQLFNENLHCP